MQFIDQARITVRAGRGGDGIAAFRREKYVPAGGPSGGDGGNGAPVVLEADSNLQTLLDFKYKRLFAADDGRRGGPNKCTGASGKDLVIKVPCGTEVRHLTTGILLGDLTAPGERLTVAFGGRGGLGNAHYLSNRNRAPENWQTPCAAPTLRCPRQTRRHLTAPSAPPPHDLANSVARSG